MTAEHTGATDRSMVTELGLGDFPVVSDSALVGSYRRLADVFRNLLSEQDLEALLASIVDALADLIPYDFITIYEADERSRTLIPVLARDPWAEEVLSSTMKFGEGITGWVADHGEAVCINDLNVDPRAVQIAGTPDEEEALISVPLTARDSVKGVLNLYRLGPHAYFSDSDFELAKRFADLAALAIDNAKIRVALEHQAQTDSLTGLYNHRFFHERLRSELTRASRSHDTIGLIIFDLDDFKRVNDVYGHGVGDQVLARAAEVLQETVRASDVACRVGGEEFAVILPSCEAADALGLARRLTDALDQASFDPAGSVTISVGIAQGPDHAANPRELVACAEAAMMAAKAGGKNRILLFEDETTGQRPRAEGIDRRDVRSIAHLKMLQSLAGKLNRLTEVAQIGETIANELRTLIDYHNCRVYIVENDKCIPIAYHGDMQETLAEIISRFTCKVGDGITGRAALTGRSLLVPNALDCEYALQVRGTEDIEESIIAVPLTYGVRVIGVVSISKLGRNQFDEDDMRLLEVLAGNASVALENARLYEAQRREARHAKALLEFADAVAKAQSFAAIGDQAVRMAAKLLDVSQAAIWLQDERSRDFRCVAHTGYAGDPDAQLIVEHRWTSTEGENFLGSHEGPYILDPEATEQILNYPDGAHASPLASVPLQVGVDLRGWICAREPVGSPGHFDKERMRLLAGLSSHASIAIQKALAYKDQKESAEVASSLLDFSGELAIANADDVYDRVAELSARILGVSRAVVWVEDLGSGEMIPQAIFGSGGEAEEKIADARLDPAAFRLAHDGQPFVLAPGAANTFGRDADVLGPLPVAVAPLNLEGGRIGSIIASAPESAVPGFSARKMRLLGGIANQAQLAINNVLNFDGLEQTFLDTVEALANALEVKDEYTSSHARWITDTSLKVGEELGMDKDGLKRLELGALFHDIGKIGIPLTILLKPGPLDDAEWATIKKHPELGERILAPIARLADVRPIVRHCHEHFDGEGYPDRFAGEDIPLESRIILVVDAFHAMTTDRPYRKRLPLSVAFSRLESGMGTQFDPRVVKAMIGLIQSHPEIAETS